MNIQKRGDGYQLRIKNKLLSKPYFHTFDNEADARLFGERFDKMLKSGIVPRELLDDDKPIKIHDPLLIEVIRIYSLNAPVTSSDDRLLTIMLGETLGMHVSSLTVPWIESYVTSLKMEKNFSPGTVRKRIGVLARVMDWHIRRTTPEGQARPGNPLRGLPIGYSHYSKEDALNLSIDQKPKTDVQRDRRFLDGEEARIRFVLADGVMPGKSRGLKSERPFGLLFSLILDTGVRLQEAYLLRCDQLELDKGFIRVEGSKGARGKVKPRTVPIRSTLAAMLRARVLEVGGTGQLFPWHGMPKWETREKTSAYLSKRFSQMFAYADVVGFTEHDLRHEVTCRWVSLKKNGQWTFSEAEIAKIMGWSSMAMMLRYLSLRGEDLANRFD